MDKFEKSKISLDINLLDVYLKGIGIENGVAAYGDNINKLTEVGLRNLFSFQGKITNLYVMEAVLSVEFLNSEHFSFDISLLSSEKADRDLLTVATSPVSLASKSHRRDMLFVREAKDMIISMMLTNLATDSFWVNSPTHYFDMVAIYSSENGFEAADKYQYAFFAGDEDHFVTEEPVCDASEYPDGFEFYCKFLDSQQNVQPVIIGDAKTRAKIMQENKNSYQQ